MDDILFNGEYYDKRLLERLQASLNEEQLQKMLLENPEEANLYAARTKISVTAAAVISDGFMGNPSSCFCAGSRLLSIKSMC